ncbi:MAG: hypothetical protein ACLQK4_08815 [Acidimicrobiales bacterium]|jgi:F0F1-type ATP synthase membrane subunit b/b'
MKVYICRFAGSGRQRVGHREGSEPEGKEAMLTEAANNALGREARNEHLIDIDIAWDSCRDDVEQARADYEEALETSHETHEELRAKASTAHHDALDEAWAAYKQEVSDRTTASRREALAAARGTYNEKASKIRESYNESVSGARDAYVRALLDACSTYELAVADAFAMHREAIESVRKLLAPSDHDGEVGMDSIESVGSIDAIAEEALAGLSGGAF